ncbi:MAG: hypothetical protein NTU79_04265 [Planctomycetota bacterium]|nr:hypothetical protein [Planctomycetota bacterium]
MTEPSTVELASGREIALVRLYQFRTYEGLIEGLPTRERNARKVPYICNEAAELWKIRVHLIEPSETTIEYDGKYPFGTPAILPGTVCFGLFSSLQPARDNSKDGSELTIVWFQNDFAFPIDDSVRQAIRTLDWDSIAVDYSY